jgi:hypothetical protein
MAGLRLAHQQFVLRKFSESHDPVRRQFLAVCGLRLDTIKRGLNDVTLLLNV